MPLNEPKYHEILLRLADAGVEAIVVGMAAAVIQGAPTMTWDLDIVHLRTKENVERLLGVLKDIDAVARGDSDFKQAVFLDKELWQHFGSEERVLEALRMLFSLAERSSRSVA